MFNIEREPTIKPPRPKHREGAVRIVWPWKDMNVGDLVRINDPEIIHRARMNCHNYGHANGLKFTAKTIDGVLHVWRVK